MKRIRILVMGTSGILNDGITAWMCQTFGAMDLAGMELVTVAFEGCEQSIVKRVEDVGFRVVSLPSRKKSPRAYMAAYRKLLKEERFDVVHVCSSSASAAFELYEARKNAIGMRIAHSHSTLCEHRIMDRMLRPILYCEATDFFACGTAAGKWLFGGRAFAVIPNGKEIGTYRFSESERVMRRAQLGIGEDSIVLGHVGRFNEGKNHTWLLEVFKEILKRIPNAVLVLIGDGALLEQVKKKASNFGISDHVRFLGRRDDVASLLNAMDAMVFPSFYEGFPNVVLEWQLNGLPVVMSDTITDECAISPLVKQVSLRAPSADWADAIEGSLKCCNRSEDSETACSAAVAAGFDIREIAVRLRGMYLEKVSANCEEITVGPKA